MQNFDVDITNCDRELIHIPGRIQSHGFMVVIDTKAFVRYYSDNIVDFLDVNIQDLIGHKVEIIEEKFIECQPLGFINQLIYFGKNNKSFELTNPFLLTLAGKPFFLIISTSADYYVLEFEPAVSDFDLNAQKKINRSISEMLTEKNVQKLLFNTARQVKNIIRFDRVMIYRFSEKGHGQVVAEEKEPELESWLGMNYPASDIPKQARELYKINLTRLIADVQVETAAISTSADNDAPLDLSFSQLRAVSPIHIQYLKNMGVCSSFSISLLYKEELWGLIACHNYTPRFIDYKSRDTSKMLGQILSSALEFRQDEENHIIQQIYEANISQLAKSLQKHVSIIDALTCDEITILNMTNASGCILVYEGMTTLLGQCPNQMQIEGLLDFIKNNIKDAIYSTASLSELYPTAKEFEKVASGLMLVVLSNMEENYIIWLKPESKQTMNWAGNPEKPVEVNQGGYMNLSPRRSFETWAEVVSGTSENWSLTEKNSVKRLKEEITYSINEKAGVIKSMNERLKSAYEELDTFSYTVSHDLKSPISAILGYAQIIAGDKSADNKWGTIASRIESRADQMNLMINEILEYSRIGRSEIEYKTINARFLIEEIVKDLQAIYTVLELTTHIGDTPQLRGDPMMVSQVFANLLGNAAKYSQESKPAVIRISGSESDATVTYIIEDNGMGIPEADLPHIFELFNRMSNVKELEGSDLGLAIVKRLIELHNVHLRVESEVGKGNKFFISFNK